MKILFPILLAALVPSAAFAQGASTDSAAAGRALSQHLNTLSTDSRNVRALIGAGEAALALEDPNAAIGFFGRAEEVDPRNSRIKAGLARALLMLEKPREALKLFDDAEDLGLDEAQIAADRGLAYDLRGDNRRAQKDYALALRRGADPEITRRMALSLGISGDREQALQLLEPLLRQQDRAAWRAQAFILAMVGDVDGANGVARQVMPGNLAKPMAPFFARMGGLSAAQKAAAVHFGHMPSDGRSTGALYTAIDEDFAPTQPTPRAGLIPMEGSGDEDMLEDAEETVPPPVSVEPRRRPGAEAAPVRLAQAQPIPAPIQQRPSPTPAQTSSPALTSVLAAQRQPAGAGTGAATPQPGFSQSPVTGSTNDRVVPAQASPPTGLAQVAPSTFSLPAASAPRRASTPASSRSLAAIVGGLELEQAEAVPIPVPVARKPEPKPATLAAKAEEKKKAAEKKPAEKKPDPKKTEPERIWAQVATGGNARALALDYGKMAKRSPAAFKGMSGWSAPFKSTRRLLVGPFTTEKKAQDFLKKAGITGFAWTSPAGTEVEKLAAR